MASTTINSEVINVPSEVGAPQLEVLELVKSGKTIYAVLCDLAMVPTGALRFGSMPTPFRFKAGTWFNFSANPETKGLYLYHPIQVNTLIPLIRLTIFYEPVTDLDLRAAWDNVWETAQVFRGVGVQAPGAQNSAIILGNWLANGPPAGAPSLPGGLGNVKNYATRLMRVDSLTVESTANGRVHLFFGGAPGDGTGGIGEPDLSFGFLNPDPLGFSNPAGRIGIGQTALFPGPEPGTLIMDVPVQGGVLLPLSDLALPVTEQWALWVRDQSGGSTLRVNAQLRVMKQNPADFDR